jgi:lysophospholipase L1-like esterase
MRNFLKKIVLGLMLSFCSIIFSLFIVELLVRLFSPQELIYIEHSELWIADDVFGSKHPANVSTQVNIDEKMVHFKTDENGYRIGDKEITDARYKILALGDSFIEALHVEHEETVTGRLESILSEEIGETVKIVNTGVAGWDPHYYLLQIKEEIKRENYDLALIFLYVGNDFDRDVRQENFTPERLRSSDIKHVFRVPVNLSKEEIINALIYPINDYLETKSSAFVLFKKRAKVLLMKIGLTANYFPQVFFRSNADSPIFRVAAEVCVDIKEVALANGVETVFVLIPTSQQAQEASFDEYVRGFNVDTSLVDMTQPNRLVKENFDDLDLFLIDPLLPMREDYKRTGERQYGAMSDHFNEKGHQLLADILTPTLKEILKSKNIKN